MFVMLVILTFISWEFINNLWKLVFIFSTVATGALLINDLATLFFIGTSDLQSYELSVKDIYYLAICILFALPDFVLWLRDRKNIVQTQKNQLASSQAGDRLIATPQYSKLSFVAAFKFLRASPPTKSILSAVRYAVYTMAFVTFAYKYMQTILIVPASIFSIFCIAGISRVDPKNKFKPAVSCLCLSYLSWEIITFLLPDFISIAQLIALQKKMLAFTTTPDDLLIYIAGLINPWIFHHQASALSGFFFLIGNFECVLLLVILYFIYKNKFNLAVNVCIILVTTTVSTILYLNYLKINVEPRLIQEAVLDSFMFYLLFARLFWQLLITGFLVGMKNNVKS